MRTIPAARSTRFARRRAEPRLFLSSHGMDYAAIEYAELPVVATLTVRQCISPETFACDGFAVPKPELPESDSDVAARVTVEIRLRAVTEVNDGAPDGRGLS